MSAKNLLQKILDYSLSRKFGISCVDEPDISVFYVNNLGCGTIKCSDFIPIVDSTSELEVCNFGLILTLQDTFRCSLNINSITLIADNQSCDFNISTISLLDESCIFEIDKILFTDNTICDLQITSITEIK